MIQLISLSLFFLATGLLTSVTVLSAYQILFTIPLAYFLFVNIKNRSFKLPTSAWFLVAFTIIALLSLLTNHSLLPSPSKNYGRLKYFIFGFGGIFVLKAWLPLATDKTKKILSNSFLASIIISGSYALYMLLSTGAPRARGLTPTLRYGYGSAMLLLVVLGCILHREKLKNWFNWKLAIPALILGFAGMYVTYTRGALLGFLCGLPFVLYYFKPKLGLTLGGLAAFGVACLVGIYLFGSGNYNSRFLMSKNNKSDYMRRSQWKAAMIATQEKPVLGWGLSNFHSQLNRIKTEYDLDAKFYNDAHAHNLFLEVASGTGILGLIAFLGWVISWAMEVFKAGGLVRALVFPFGVAFVISSQFEVTFDANNASMIFFLYALSLAIKVDAAKRI
ncbi:MAG: O-antigen ligase family protein [Bacteriovoracaceae bacterium]|nr:O-antigen ligase family protein [Bacteriovoracaceae bacterium]